MEHLEMVEKLKAKTGVTYEEAKGALEACQWDMLDAIVYLEKLGKVKEPVTASYSTQYEQSEQFEKAASAHSKKSTFAENVNKFFSWCGDLIRKGNENFFNIDKDGEKFVTMPITIFVLLLLFAFWIVVPLLIVGLFFGFKYSFSGKVAEGIDLNGAMNKASEVAENLKKDFENKNQNQ
ncbi:MAG: DUF4342 domain-containing protein [Thermoflexaceae bacterium]|nr:DUF4342 domain-containing protein [Thermoflexaceae bacterium]